MKKVYILLAVLIAMSAATLAFAAAGFFRTGSTETPNGEIRKETEDIVQPQQNNAGRGLDLNEKLGVSFLNTDPMISVTKNTVSFYVYCLDDTAWQKAEKEFSARDGLSQIRNGIMIQTHEDAFDMINTQIMDLVHIEYWPSVVDGYSYLQSIDGVPVTEGRLPDPFVGTFVLLDSQKKQVCIYHFEEEAS
ncbi:MAG: hypothetical protein II781_00655 [Clostridia bacterium]|nr:hypothetical protein [Clostridia bacterium]